MGARENDTNDIDSGVNEGLNLENDVTLEVVGKFCYLGDMLNGSSGYAHIALMVRMQCV